MMSRESKVLVLALAVVAVVVVAEAVAFLVLDQPSIWSWLVGVAVISLLVSVVLAWVDERRRR